MRNAPPLSEFTTLGVGGAPQRLAAVRDVATLAAELRAASEEGLPLLILGGGSNLLVSDDGFPGVVLRLEDDSLRLTHESERLRIDAAAGCPWDRLVARSVEEGSPALAPLSGIPGSCGAAPLQNIGAYGVELAEHLDSVELFDRHEMRSLRMPASELEMGYRDSRLKSRDVERFVVLSIRLMLPASGELPLRYEELRRRFAEEKIPHSAAALRELVLRIRRGKSMVLDSDDPNSRSAGSFFTNPIVSEREARDLAARLGDALPRWKQKDGRVKLSAAWCIEHAGFHRGERRGAAALSSNHVLALCNPDGLATARQLLAFAREIHERVQAELGIALEAEPQLIGFSAEELGPLRRTAT